MPIPINTELYNAVKAHINTIYKKPSAYRSGAYVRLYKQLGGTYKNTPKAPKNIDSYPLARWFAERWQDVNPDKTKSTYPLYRPTIRITQKTPKTKDEISVQRLREQAKTKQIIKGKTNLPKF
jgi:Family of unknown function (DUF5872)